MSTKPAPGHPGLHGKSLSQQTKITKLTKLKNKLTKFSRLLKQLLKKKKGKGERKKTNTKKGTYQSCYSLNAAPYKFRGHPCGAGRGCLLLYGDHVTRTFLS